MTVTSAFRMLALWMLVPGTALALVLSVSGPAQARVVDPRFFGMHDSRIADGETPGVAAGAVRLWDTRTSWRHIERRKGRFTFAAVDKAVKTAETAGLRPMIVLGQTPRFHATKPGAAGAYGRGASSMPRLRPWLRYVGKVANRYRDRVDYQIWNEPNVVNYWSGSIAQMAKLTTTAGKKITAVAGRGATVAAPAFPLRLPGQRTWYKKYWATKGVAAAVDVVSANLYPMPNQGPEASMNLLAYAKRALPRAARRKELWNTEINYGLRGGATATPISPDLQEAYVARTLLLNASSVVRRLYWYSWDIDPRIANTHLSQDGSTRTSAGVAWDVVRGWLVGADLGSCTQANGVYTCTATAAGEVRRFYWKPSGPGTQALPESWTSYTDVKGNRVDRPAVLPPTVVPIGPSPIMVSATS